jgi:iron complex outermembrane receptor protein
VKYKTDSFLFAVFFAMAVLIPAILSPTLCSGEELGLLSLSELLDVEVISGAKVPEKATATPAAIFVITQEDLRRNSVQNIPDALRMVPGMHVYQIDANKWAVSARGSASRFSNKMLVMIDGRTVYSPLFSGVFWDVQDLMIEDIERIEVIRGPGGTLWGANAVNGVINIISKESADTQGGLVAVQAESSNSGEISTRYGGWLNDRTSYRLYGKFFDRGNFETSTGDDADDEYHQARAGFRMDMNLTASNKLTFQGDLYGGESGESMEYITPFPPFQNLESTDAPVSGGNLLARWTRTFSNTSEMTLLAYYDRTNREEFFVDETIDTADIDFQHRLNMEGALEILWGLGYRYTKSDMAGKEIVPGFFSYSTDPQVRTDNLFSGFVQGRIPIAGKKGELTLGTKLEHNDYTGFEWQPNARFMWNLNENHSLWTAVSRTVRTPSRTEHDATMKAGGVFLAPEDGGFLSFVTISGNDEISSETVYSYEAGYRGRPGEELFFDLTIYYNKYKDLVSGNLTGIPQLQPDGYVRFPYLLNNVMDGETYGAEVSCGWSVTDWWRLTGGFTWFQFNVLNEGSAKDARMGFGEDENAEHLVSLVSYMDLPNNLEINTSLYFIGALDGLDIGSRTRFDLNIAWHPTDTLTVVAGGRNLFQDGRQEFPSTMDGILASNIEQTLYTKAIITF